jgi:hypothetical protein
MQFHYGPERPSGLDYFYVADHLSAYEDVGITLYPSNSDIRTIRLAIHTGAMAPDGDGNGPAGNTVLMKGITRWRACAQTACPGFN